MRVEARKGARQVGSHHCGTLGDGSSSHMDNVIVLINRQQHAPRVPVRAAHAAIHGGDAGVFRDPPGPRGRGSLAETVDELKELAGVPCVDVSDPEAVVLQRLAHCVPGDEATGAVGVVVAGPKEVAPPFVELFDCPQRQRDGPAMYESCPLSTALIRRAHPMGLSSEACQPAR
jgi:hypothetical protein